MRYSASGRPSQPEAIGALKQVIRQLKRWHSKRILARSPHRPESLRQIADGLPLLDRLDEPQMLRLIRLATLFLHEKTVAGGSGFEPDIEARQVIALQACLPILNLDLDWYAGWSTLIIYEDAFRHEEDIIDDDGVAHVGVRELAGEAWLQGPVILSWADILDDQHDPGHNVIIHELAHKLDMRNGKANGYPPLPAGMLQTEWTTVMSAAFEEIQHSSKPGIDPYAASDPAEFFAVMSELFFDAPECIMAAWPQVYTLLATFYRQSTLGQYN